MKKYLLIVLAIFLMTTVGCTQQQPQEEVVHFSVDEGKQIVTNFLTAVVKNDKAAAEKDIVGEAKQVYTKELTKLSGAGFTILDANEVDGGAEYHGKFFESKEATPYFVTNDFVVVMEKTAEGDYVISNVKFNKEITITQKSTNLIANENGTETILFNLKDVPAQASPRGVDGKQFAVDKKAFGPVALSADKRTVIFALNGTHAFLGRYDLDSRAVTPVDMYFEGNIRRISWAPDGNLYAVDQITAKGTHTVVMYDTLADDIYPFPGGDIFKDPDFSISQPLFVGNNFYFLTNNEKNKSLSGWWVYNFKSGKIGKVLR